MMTLVDVGSVFSATIDTPDGPFTLMTDDSGAVLAAGWGDSALSNSRWGNLTGGTSAAEPANARLVTHAPAASGQALEALVAAEAAEAAEAVEAVEAYYAGDLEAPLRVPVRTNGTELQEAGWRALREIPAGEPLTYASFAAALGRPSAVRAAASICARNPAGLFVPCHRVLRGDGSLGGFAWGLETKRALLNREA